MKNQFFLLAVLNSLWLASYAQNVGIGTISPTNRLHVVDSANTNKNTLFAYAGQPYLSSGDQQNTGVTGFGQGNGVGGNGVTSYGYAIGVKGIGSIKSFGAVGVYAGIGASVPDISFGNGYYALFADAGVPANNTYAAAFLNGNVGIGTLAPTSRLHVTNTADVDKTSIYSYASQSPGISGDLQNTAITGFGEGNGIGGNGPTSYGYGIGVKGIGSINSFGAVGVYAAIGATLPNISSGHTYYALYAAVETPASNSFAGVFLNGNVGIGTNNPSLAGLVVNAKVGATNAVLGANTTGVSIESNWPGIGFNTYFNGSRKFIANGYGGLVGLSEGNGEMSFLTYGSGTAGAVVSPARGFVFSHLNNSLYPINDNAYTLGRSGARWSAVYSVNGTIQTSDARLKTNIVPSSYGLKQIMQLRSFTYDWKDGSNGQSMLGLLAQDVRTVIPEAVVGDDQKEYLGIKYDALIPVLIKGIQELEKENIEMKAALIKQDEMIAQLQPANKK